MTRLLALLFLVTSVAAQADAVRFKPKEHLPQFDERRDSVYTDLYDFSPYDKLYGESLDDGELSQLRSRWTAECAAADERIALIEGDAIERSFWELEKRLSDHPFFSKVDYLRQDADGPFIYLVQDPDKADAGYPKRVADFYGRWLAMIERIFRDEYAEPLGLQRRPDYPAYFIAVLSSPGAYTDYADAVELPGLYDTRAHYNPELRLSVTYTNPFRPEPKSEERRAALHELVHAMEHAYSAADERPTSVFFSEGLADFLSAHTGFMPGALREHPVDRTALELLLAAAGSPDVAKTHLPPLEELVGLETYQDVYEHFRNRAAKLNGTVIAYEQAISLLYAQASLWMHYLHKGNGGKYRDAILRYVRATQAGEGGVDGLIEAFEGHSLDELNAGLRRYVNDQFKLTFSSTAGGRRLAAKPDPLPGWTAPAEERSASPVTFSAESLAPDGSDPYVRFALSLELARRGSYSAAARDLRAALGLVDDELRTRMQREADRLDAMVALRRRFIEHLPTVNKKLKVELPEGRLLAAVERVDDGFVYVKKNRLQLDRLALDSIDGMQLVDEMRDRRSKFPEHWLFAYPYVLTGNERWKRLLDDTGPEASALRQDAEDDYPERLRYARAVDTLFGFSRSELGSGASGGDVEATFAAIAELVRSCGDLELVQQRKAGLRTLGRLALENLFAQSGLPEVLTGNYEDLGKGRVRLAYDFDEDSDLADFVEEDYLVEILDSWGKEADRSTWVRGGVLHSQGFLFLRHVLTFRGNTSFECTFKSLSPQGSYDPRAAFLLGLCDDGLGSVALVEGSGSLRVIDPHAQHMQFAEATDGLYFDRKYKLRASSDGKTVRSQLNGKEVGRVESGSRTEGGLFVWSYADYTVEIDRIVIEGEPVADSLGELRDGWVAERLATAGL